MFRSFPVCVQEPRERSSSHVPKPIEKKEQRRCRFVARGNCTSASPSDSRRSSPMVNANVLNWNIHSRHASRNVRVRDARDSARVESANGPRDRGRPRDSPDPASMRSTLMHVCPRYRGSLSITCATDK